MWCHIQCHGCDTMCVEHLSLGVRDPSGYSCLCPGRVPAPGSQWSWSCASGMRAEV